jgi:hypothetical protein
MRTSARRRERLTDLPNIGPATATDLMAIGIRTPGQLAVRDPLATFRQLAGVMGPRHDPCVLYMLLSARHFLDGGTARPWWEFTTEGKVLLGRTGA